MSWERLIDFARGQSPSFMASLAGVSPGEIAAVEQEYRVQLPETYRQFLLLMGEDSGGFHLFGPHQNQRFRDVVAQLPEESCPLQEFYKIAFVSNESIASPDHYLDLRRSDGTDAPIVMFEGGEEFTPADVRDKGFTFLEQMYRRLFAFLADQRLPERALLTIPKSPGQDEFSTSALVSSLAELNFAPAVPLLPRVGCLRRGAFWIIVDEHVEGRGAALSLWSDDSRALAALVDQLLGRFPSATYRPRPAPPGK